MRRPWLIPLLLLCACVNTAIAAGSRYVIDDTEYTDRITENAEKLLRQHKLVSSGTLRKQVRNREFPLSFAPESHQVLSPPDLCEHLRASTLTVGTYYKCPDCPLWHYNGSAAFVVRADGVICTCCHVVLSQDDGIKESYLVAADSEGHVYPVRSVAAADTEADTCFLKIDATGLKPLPLRTGVRAGERVYCLSHPGGYYFMFSQGMVARLNRRPNDVVDEHGHTNGLMTRPILFLNVTAEFAPGSSGAAMVDEAGNVVGQVASIADAGEPPEAGATNAPISPSVPIRFCTASEEIRGLAELEVTSSRATRATAPAAKTPPQHSPKAEPPSVRKH
jgi:hypothetical protein